MCYIAQVLYHLILGSIIFHGEQAPRVFFVGSEKVLLKKQVLSFFQIVLLGPKFLFAYFAKSKIFHTKIP